MSPDGTIGDEDLRRGGLPGGITRGISISGMIPGPRSLSSVL